MSLYNELAPHLFLCHHPIKTQKLMMTIELLVFYLLCPNVLLGVTGPSPVIFLMTQIPMKRKGVPYKNSSITRVYDTSSASNSYVTNLPTTKENVFNLKTK